MAKRKAKARARKAGRKARPTATGAAALKPKARQPSRKSARDGPARRGSVRRRARATAPVGTKGRPRRKAVARKAAPAKPGRKRRSARPKPAGPLARAAAAARGRDLSRRALDARLRDRRLRRPSRAIRCITSTPRAHRRRTRRSPAAMSMSDWNDAYSSGEETPGGDMPTPDQDVVEEIGRALGVEYEDAEELKGAEKIEARDRTAGNTTRRARKTTGIGTRSSNA